MVNKKSLWVFNPDCEMAIANGSKYYMPPANIVKMEEDLAFLPAFLGDPGDFVLVKNLPDADFMESIYQTFHLKVRCIQKIDTEVGRVLKGEPWGKSPKMCHWFAERGMGEEWHTEQKELYSRKVAREGLIWLLDQLPGLEADLVPRMCVSIEEIEQAMSAGKYLVKAPWSSSGKGILVLEKPLAVKEKEWLRGILKRQGYVMLEKRLNKVQDFAMEFRSEDSGVEFIGWSVFSTGENGEYRGNYLGPQKNMEKSLIRHLGEEKLWLLKESLPKMLTVLLPEYQGCLGVDMMIYSDRYGNYKLQPCVEINLRYNMGIVALALSERYLSGATEGEFTVRFYARSGEALREHCRLQESYPAIYEDNRMCSGYLNLTPLSDSTAFVASILCY